ncbi:hypothetical protein COW36_06400 [bacterium (Candidatus Blackallbacteria) CG17_big_fil_post_rev_8_21_14_2_50_48_46]|uniref:DUF4404 domain-containing protein n=1 Tax=bacterium (Candidatus Blackallbacteria) CG17_big_fil_post_rev_8_21_14_2_50_48_46 TaxID=2014261 RepID=A0A2M7G8M8_9BACT|nr:MAG: hypothetical protein COW64_17230 [bacterium (Candidatus Blackallbacteria) CG18_big_fil_WC_8_21_14_2_50_49_26]PIW18156.1 MAG: hypothetical protein COW36_06400 [bacterium (Candidatus Blackallbacteria) CG17_big_fil_post_rev_8_21_14_2_50_48_46]PIW47009.1 MAG: hypothetical protein COW20_13845 [bacterium (Candidatus Blackallbacteria) CG13_big_fil_rev_8_21_14_2_50_49_14]
MNSDNLKHAVQALREEIAQLDPSQESHRERLENLLCDLEKQISGETETQGQTLSGLNQLVTHFESEHPKLTDILNRISVLLSNMGI